MAEANIFDNVPMELAPSNLFADAPMEGQESQKPSANIFDHVPMEGQEGQQTRQPSRGFLGELTTSLFGTLIRENPRMVGNALEALAEISEPDPVEKAGTMIGAMVDAPAGAPPPEPGPTRLRQLATAVQEFGKTGEAERRPAVPSLFDIRTSEGLGTMAEDAVAYLAQGIGQAAGSTAPSVGVGLATAAVTENPIAGFVAGAFGPSYVQNLGDTYGAMRDDKDIQAAVKSGKITQKQVAEIAAAFSVPMAALDTIQAERIFGAAAKELKGNLLKRMLKRGVIGAATEAPTEAAQQALQEAAIEVGGGQKSFADQAKAVVDSFVIGAAGGGTISTLHPGSQAAETPVPGEVPPGAAPAADVLPPEEPPPGGAPGEAIPGVSIVPANQAPPAPNIPAFAPESTAVVSDPEVTLQTGEKLPAGALDGQTVTVLHSDKNMSIVRDADGNPHRIGNDLLKPVSPTGETPGPPPAGGPPAAPTLTPKDVAIAQSLDQQVAAAIEVPDSPRLTPLDRTSPIPNDIIDSGKKIVEQATGKESTFTSTTMVNGKRQVVTANVSDLIAANRVKTAALVEQITAGVSVPQNATLGQPGAAPVSATGAPAIALPAEAAASPEPAIATAEAPRFQLQPQAIPNEIAPQATAQPQVQATTQDLDRRFGPPGTQARTLEEARLARPQPTTPVTTPSGDVIEVSHPNYETFEARVNGQKVGTLSVSPNGPHASSVTVSPAAQRQGVATALYDEAELALGRPLTPSPMGMTGDAIAFWKQRLGRYSPEQKQALLQEALDTGIRQKIPKSARARVDALGYEEGAAPQASPPTRAAEAPATAAPTEAAAAPRAANETDKEFAKRVVDKRPAPETLPEKYDDYFIMKGATVVPIGDLVSSKTDEENRQGGGNAVKRMAAAAKGELARRGPITVEPITSGPNAGKYLITDGNGTYTSVKGYGWKSMPVMVEKAAAPAEAAPTEAAPTEALPAAPAPHTTSFTGEEATPEQRRVFLSHPYKTVDAILEDAQARQDELAAVGKELADKIEGVKFKNPGLKKRETLEEKIPRKNYKDAGQLTDAIRIGFDVSEPGLASEIIRGLARHFEVLDEGWGVLDTGYFDRKVLVRFDDGRIGEVQFWEPHLLKAKEKGFPHIADGTRGAALYTEERGIKDKTLPRAIELNGQMNELYGYALSLAASAWAKVVNDGNLSKPAPKYLNLRRQFSSDISRQELRTSEKSASTQSVEPGSSSALASKSEKTTGRSSQLQNFTNLTSFPDNNVVQPAAEVKGEEAPRFQARTIREGSEAPEGMGLPQTRTVGKKLKKIRYTTRQIAAALEARQRDKYGTIGREDRSPEARERIANWIVDEVEFEMQPGRGEKSGVGWYSTKFQRALDAFGTIFPELTGRVSMSLPGMQRLGHSRKNTRDFFTSLIAITSDGQKVAGNFENAAKLYGEFRQSGTIDIDKVTFGGDRNTSIKTNIANVLHMLERYGPAEMHKVLMDEQTVTDLKQTAKQTGAKFSTKLQAHVRMPLSALIFGPKLGAFYANLMGAHGYLTMDRWWSRTFNRYRGQLLARVSGLAAKPTDRQGNKIGLARFKEMIGQPNLSDEEALSEAAYHAKLYGEKGFKNGTDIEKTANTITKDTLGTEDAPFGAVDRTFMIDTAELARQKLADRGQNISIADIQAIMWYYEKRLYSELGARETADISYEEVARRVAEGTAEGVRPGRPAVQDEQRGPDGASFSVSQEARAQGAEGQRGADRGRADARAAQAAQQKPEVAPLPNLYDVYPSSVGPNAKVVSAKQAYLDSVGTPYRRQAEYVKVDPARGKRLADAFEAMPHAPHDPEVARSYRAMIDETIAQFRILQSELGLKIQFIKPGQANPYQFSPRLAMQDVLENGHLWVYPTSSGFGSLTAIRDNPMLERTGIVIDGHNLVANDVFRIVHDIFGHGPEGAGFGPHGEENAWQSHVRMYSPLAARAMTTETRGQNSWVNYGPHGKANQANPQNTVFADQKVGLLPEWATTEGLARDEAARLKASPAVSPEIPTTVEAQHVAGGIVHFALSPQMAGKAEALFKTLRGILDGLGLNNVDLKVWQQIFADMEHGAFGVDGMYLRNLIHIALDSRVDPKLIVHHEAIHALWASLTPSERAILERKSQKEWITDDIKAMYPEEQWVEEGVAHAYADWIKGAKPDGMIARIFRKMQSVIKALYQALTKHDIRTDEDIFRQITRGEIGRRAQRAAGFETSGRFAVQQAPHNQQQSQAVAQGFLSQGQPVDRAIRLPFSFLGGLDNQNRWNVTKRLTDKMGPQMVQASSLSAALGGAIGAAVGGPIGGVAGFFAAGTAGAYILGTSPSPTNGKFGWFAGMAENAKRGLIDGYGLNPDYVEAYRQSDLGKAAILREAQGIMKVLSNASVGTAEAKVLQQILTGTPVNDADMTRLAVPIRQAIDDLGAEAVQLGLISAESFQRNRGSYLHRVYTKNEVDQNTLAGWVSTKMAGRRKKIIGDSLKGRGIFLELSHDRLMRDVGIHPAPTKGDTWKILDRISATNTVTKRVYFPANRPVPMEFSGKDWVDRGNWEVRQISPGKATLWRDYTEEERGKMGELVDARYTIAKTFMLMANDLSTGRFYRDVAANPEWASAAEPATPWKEGSEYSRYWNDPEIQWVKVPDTAIPKTGGKKRWGALAGKFVRAEIWRDLNEVDIANNPGTWRKLITQWKLNKTARNPVVHMNNIMSNMLLMDLGDVRMQDLVGGIKAYYGNTAEYQEARDNGAFGSDMVSQEIREQILKPILEEITKQQTGAANPFLARAGMLGVIADKLWTTAKTIDNGMLHAYQVEDEMFRMATYMRRRSQGESPRVAALNARDQFLNYDIRAPWVVAMRNSLLPFISYTYRAVPKLMESIAHRPWKLAKYMAIAYAVNALAYGLLGDDDDDEERERAALRDEEQGNTWLGLPRMLRMPWRDAHGLPVFLDVRRWLPGGDMFDTQQGSAALPIPAPIQFGGPIQLAFEFMLNKQAFTGKEITNDLTQDTSEKATSVADWAWKAWAPASFWTPNSWYWTKIGNALYGATDEAGHPYSVPQAFLSSIGIKVKPVDVENGIMWHFYDFKKVQGALRTEMRALSRQLDRGLISQSAFDSGAARIMSKFENLGKNVDEFSEKTRKHKKEVAN